MRTALTLIAALTATTALAADDAPKFKATLVGHAALPAQTLIPAPADAPEALKVSGKFTTRGNPARITAAPTDGESLPFNGQTVQGFSGIKSIDGKSFTVLTDNGFGSKANSPDAMLFYHVVTPNFETGDVNVEKTTFFSDPNKVIPFIITMEGSDQRYLTGADFDIEGFQMVGDDIVIGDEFGPYIFVANAETGVITEFHETVVDGETIKSPDHYTMRLPNPDGEMPIVLAKRSRGYEGFAQSVDGTMLYPLLEGPLWNPEAGDYERVNGIEALRLLEMDAATRAWTGRSWLYPMAQDGNAIGDFNMIDETRGLVIERDGGQGHPDLACTDGATEGCFEKPALFKRVYMIDMAGVEPGQPVKKVGYIDLMDIADPDGVARIGKREDGRFAMPFVTIENVDRVSDTQIIVANDNNFPFSKGRDLVDVDNNEMIILDVADFLNARAE
ncbi:MAG: esterase-like activity of phytase family protein [Pseudomonadota bacterium]